MDDETHEKKIKYFFNQKEKVHVKVKSGLFFNGFIIEINSEFFILDDRRIGQMPIFFSELIDILKYEVEK